MNSTRIQDIKQESARILIQYSNGYLDACMRGAANEDEIFNNMTRLHYLWSVIDNSFLSGTVIYVGDTIIADNDYNTVYEKIQHYSGIYSADLSDYTDIVADDGDSGSEEGGSSTSQDHYRSGYLPVVAGANPVTFLVNGVPTPLASADYVLDAYSISESGQMQTNVVPTSKTVGGFVASDILKAGTLYYTARLIT